MKNFKILIVSMMVLLSTSTYAQIEDFLKGGTDDANVLFNHYMTPFMKGVGYGFNNGWYNTAKPHESFGFDLTISFNAAYVPVEDQTFTFDPTEYKYTRIASGPTELPTLMGENSATTLENFIDQQEVDPNLPPGEIVAGSYESPSGIADNIRDFGINKVLVPSPIVQIGVGIAKGTEIKVRWLPTIDNQDFSYKYFGIGGMHSVSQWIPAVKKLKFLDISAFVGYTKISLDYVIPDGNIAGSDQQAQFEVNTLTYQIVASAHVAVITGYIGLGMDNFKTNFKLLGTYSLYQGQPYELSFVDPINLEASGSGGFRTTIGARLKLAIFTLHADYTIREYNTLTFGLGFSFR